MSRFNLIDNKWIPVRYPDGARDELGISETLLRAKDIAAIEDSSPLVMAALHRFLLAVLYRALEGPTDIEQAKALFRDGFPSEKISAYLETWRGRFWLFDEEYPFGQNPHVGKNQIEPWTKLTAEFNATTNKVLFDHTNTKRPGAKEPKECARWLLSTMTFSIAGGRGYYPSPSPNAIFCIPQGRNLHETLCYNLVPYSNRHVMELDSALWEREPKVLPIGIPKQRSFGYADLYTWQARMILFEDRPSGDIETIRFVAGFGFENPSSDPDPMQPYKISKANGKLPVRFREDRGTWRDFDSLLPDNAELAPHTIQNALALTRTMKAVRPKSVLALGLRYEPPSANVDFWRMEKFILPEAFVTNDNIRTEIRQLLQDADDAQKALWLACRSFARNILSRGDRDPASRDINEFVEQLPINAWYWSRLETRFHEILHDYTLERDSDDIRCQWLKTVRDTLRTAWQQHKSAVSSSDAWTIRALIKAESPIFQKVREINEEIQNLEPKEGVA